MFTLDRVVPWGRSFDEYRRMFALTEADLQLTILCCADGPASFNAEATSRGLESFLAIRSIDLQDRQIRDRISATYSEVLDQTQRNAERVRLGHDPFSGKSWGGFAYGSHGDVSGRLRGWENSGPVCRRGASSVAVPRSNVPAGALFAFPVSRTNHLDESFHLASIQRNVPRTAVEVRIFPLLALGGATSPYVDLCDRCSPGFQATTPRLRPHPMNSGEAETRCCGFAHSNLPPADPESLCRRREIFHVSRFLPVAKL